MHWHVSVEFGSKHISFKNFDVTVMHFLVNAIS